MRPWSLLFSLCALPAVFAITKEHQQLIDLAAAGNGVINLDSATYDLLVSPKRSWSATIHFTALDKRRRCNPCREFEPSYNAVAQAWTKVAKPERDNHFFATLDFDNGQAVFQKLGLASAPLIYVYPPLNGPRATGKTNPSTYDFTHGYDAEPLATALSHHTPIPIPYKAPFNWSRWIAIATSLLVFAITLRFISPILQNRWVWAVGTIATSLIMVGGYMFTRIRGVPYTGADGNWIAGGYQNQFGQEVHVIAGLYGFLASCFLVMILVVPYQTSPSRQRVQIYLWTFIIMFVYSMLVSLFRVKNRGYPFRLFL